MILLDTNIVSEAWRDRPDPAVVAWIDAQPTATLYICTPVLAELYFGAERLPPGQRRERLMRRIEQTATLGFRDRILPFDLMAAAAFGRVAAQREKIGRRMSPVDGMIAAIALAHGMALATRDARDFSDLDIQIIDPFKAPVAR